MLLGGSKSALADLHRATGGIGGVYLFFDDAIPGLTKAKEDRLVQGPLAKTMDSIAKLNTDLSIYFENTNFELTFSRENGERFSEGSLYVRAAQHYNQVETLAKRAIAPLLISENFVADVFVSDINLFSIDKHDMAMKRVKNLIQSISKADQIKLEQCGLRLINIVEGSRYESTWVRDNKTYSLTLGLPQIGFPTEIRKSIDLFLTENFCK